MDDHRDLDSDSDVEADAGPSTSHHHLSSSSRQMRNEAEKKRRDTLNGYITELGRLVPTVDSQPRRIDKISILRLAATYLMQNQILHKKMPQGPFLPISFGAYNLSLSMVEDMNAFMLVVTSAGKIVFVSHTVEKLLGHPQIDMFGQSLYNFVQKEDHSVLSHSLQPDGTVEAPAEPEAGSGDETSCSSGASLSPLPVPAPHDLEPEMQRRSFFLELSQRCVSRSEQPEFKRVHVVGNLRVPHTAAQQRRAHRHTGDWTGSECSGEPVLVAIVKLESRIKELSLMESCKDEYVTRHLIDGRIIYSDHRISQVAGYLTEEVNGMSGFKFMHHEDVMFTIVALRQMYDRGEGFGCSCYRLQSKTGQFIYLRTHGYLEKNEDTNEVESFICINTLVREEDGKRLIQEMKTRYSANIESSRQNKAVTESENKLEEAISQLIPATVEPPIQHSPFPDLQYMKAALTGKSLPPASVHVAQANLGSPKLGLGSPTSDEPSAKPALASPPSPTAGCRAERPSVIKSGLRRRRHDSDTPTSHKRKRSPQERALVIQVPPQMSSEEMSRAIFTRRPCMSAESYPPRTSSPVKQTHYGSPMKTRRYTHSSDLSLSAALPFSFLSCDAGEETLLTKYHSPHVQNYSQNVGEDFSSTNHSPTEDGFLSPSTRPNLLSPHLASHTVRDHFTSPNVSNCPNEEDVLSPTGVPYPNHDEDGPFPRQASSSPSQPSYGRQALVTSDPADESMFSVDLGSTEHNQYLIESVLEQPDQVFAQVPVSTSGDNYDRETPLLVILGQTHSKLESSLQLQQMQFTSIEQDIKQVPKPHSDQVYKNFTELKDEHTQNQQLLDILKQDHKNVHLRIHH